MKRPIRVRHCHDSEAGDSEVVVRVDRVQRQPVRDCGGGDQRVVGAGGGLAPRAAQIGGDLAERACSRRIERDRSASETGRALQFAHSAGSTTWSRSRLNRVASTAGNRFHRSRRVAASSPRGARGRNSATGRPERVTVSRSPPNTRSITSRPWFLRSRIVTLATVEIVSRVLPAGYL